MTDELIDAREAIMAWQKAYDDLKAGYERLGKSFEALEEECAQADRTHKVTIERYADEIGRLGKALQEAESASKRRAKYISALKADVARLTAELEAARNPDPPVIVEPDPDPPVHPEPMDRHPVKAGQPAGPIGLHRGSASYEYTAMGLPGGIQDGLNACPDYEIVPRSRCHWIVTEDGARSNDGAQTFITRDAKGNVIGAVYRAHVAAGKPLPCRVGIDCSDGGRIVAGGLYNPNDASEIGGEGIQLELVGLRADAEVTAGWSNRYGYVEHFGLYNLFLRGVKDSFCIRAMEKAGTIIRDGCTILPGHEHIANGDTYTSMVHTSNFVSYVVANCDQRRVKEQPAPVKVREHIDYAKVARGGGVWRMHCYDIGGNRTAEQIRPDGPDKQDGISPLGFKGDILFAKNLSRGYGWDHESPDGGQLYTAWQNPWGRTVFAFNKATNLRYGAIGALTQGDYRSVYNANGRSMGEVHLVGNEMEGLRSQRAIAVISGADEVHIWPGNKFEGTRPLVIDNEWGAQNNPIATGKVIWHDGANDALLTWDAATAQYVQASGSLIRARGDAWRASAHAVTNIDKGASR